MKKLALMLTISVLAIAPAASAQNHGEIGAFLDYTRLHHAGDANMLGLGGRIGFNVHSNVQFEAEMAYDFERAFTNISTTTLSNGSTTTSTVRSNLRLWNGMFGPKFQTGGGAVRAFFTVKGGFLNFAVNNQAPAQGFATGTSFFLNGDTNGVFYPGGGLEFYAGPLGLRFEVGDEMYFDRGANNNLKITIGPQIRF